MSDQAYHWTEGDAHKVGRLAIVDGYEVRDKIGRILMRELHTERLTFVPGSLMTEYLGDKTPAKQEART